EERRVFFFFSSRRRHTRFSRDWSSDVCSSDLGFRIALNVPTADEAHRIFNALASGGTVDMPLTKTFWSPLYGQVTDQFGVGWMKIGRASGREKMEVTEEDGAVKKKRRENTYVI